ncbi:MAG: M3 family oligoendopeptidase [Leadbetterella sp.]
MSSRILRRRARTFLPENFVLDSWSGVEKWFITLLDQEPSSKEEFQTWLTNKSELQSYLSENMAWRYIKMTCNTADTKAKEAFDFFVNQISPQMAPFEDKLNKKTLELFSKFPIEGEAYHIMIRGIKQSIEIYREENIELYTQAQMKQSEYQAIIGAMTIEHEGETLTMPQAASKLQSTDRNLRENIYRKIAQRRLQDSEKLEDIFDQLLVLRNKISHNAGFSNFRDYMFAAMGRFDYTVQDCLNFHDSVAKFGVPLSNSLVSQRKSKLGMDSLKPWDLSVDVDQKDPLKPFDGGVELLEKSVQCFHKINPQLAEKILIMKEMGHFDLESRAGKAPGGYNYPLEETGVPFIFMNAAGTLRDVVTMVHEGGHAFHSFAVREMDINAFRNPTMEVAELASMSMELISMEHWDTFFEDEAELKRAKAGHLRDILSTLPWIMTIDKFQHWIYQNPTHTRVQRKQAWIDTYETFADSIVDWTGFEESKAYMWHKQLHIFEVPFYYIEYGMAQLGAISVWKNYKANPEKGLQQYLSALDLGYTRTIGDIYKEAGIEFNFSGEYISELMDFVKQELEKCV